MGRTCLLLVLVALGGCAGERLASYGMASERLDRARADLYSPLGATTYTLNRQDLLDQPGGDNAPLSRPLARLPGVTVGRGGQVRLLGL